MKEGKNIITSPIESYPIIVRAHCIFILAEILEKIQDIVGKEISVF